MDKKRQTRSSPFRRFHLQLSEKEYNDLHKECSKTTCRSFAEYIRSRIFGRPVIIKYRNESLDTFLQTIFEIRNSLERIDKDSSTHQEIGEIKSQLIKLYEQWSSK
jgi:hypothetical protein